MTTTITSPVITALDHFLCTWAIHDMMGDVAKALTCVEVDALADVLRVHGYHYSAACWIDAHSDGDDEGDAHYAEPDPAPVVEPVLDTSAYRTLMRELRQIADADAYMMLAEEDPETFGAGHLVLYSGPENQRRFAITEITDLPEGDYDREVIGWTWITEHRDNGGEWITDLTGSALIDTPGELPALIAAARSWATE